MIQRDSVFSYYSGAIEKQNFEGIVTPGQMWDMATVLNSEFDRVASSFANSPALDTVFVTEWQRFWLTWRKFYASLDGVSGYTKRLWAGTADEIDRYRAELIKWQNDAKSLGGQITGPSVAAPETQATLAGTLNKVALIAGLGLVGLVILKFLPARK